MKSLLLNLLLYATVLALVLLAQPSGSPYFAIWILPLLLSVALFLGILLSSWFQGGINSNLRRSFGITIPSVAILFLLTYCVFCLSVLL